MMPPAIFPDLIMVHPQFGFALFQALLNGPAEAAEPNKCGQSGAEWGIAGKIAVDRFFAQGAADNQPDFFIRQTLVREDHLSFGKFILRPLHNSVTNM